MKLLFLILAHDRPEHTVELARVLVAAASDATALIHFDARADQADFEILRAASTAEPRIRLVKKRVSCRWGSFGLVEAPLNALAQVEAEGLAPDYVLLLSGACLPCRPVRQLERYLTGNSGREFIESQDEGWVTGGWRSERWRYRHWFDHKTQRAAEWGFFQIQRLLRLKRRFPAGLTPRFGSQWWVLSWAACQAMLADIRRAPERLEFFRSVWIPDEMVFQTYVHALVPPEAIAGFGLTHFQFSNRGKPTVFYEDHADYAGTLQSFFLRKVSPGAARLRSDCLAIAGQADDGAPLDKTGTRRDDYKLKIAAQTHYPVSGQVFYRDQFADMSGPVLAGSEIPYVVLAGPPALTARIAARLPQPPFTVFGEVFDAAKVDLGAGRDMIGGLRRTDVAIRDMHPALYLTRLLARAPDVPVVTWAPVRQCRLLADVLRDPNALVVAMAPDTGDPARDRADMVDCCMPPGALDAAMKTLPGITRDRARRAVSDSMGGKHECDMALWLASGVAPSNVPGLRRPDIVLPLEDCAIRQTASERDRLSLEAALRACRFREAAWFGALARALERSFEETAPEPAAMEDAT